MVDLSVIIPMHDAGAYIGATLDSLSAQTVSPREVIVVDDGSTDVGPDIVEGYRFPDGSRPVLIRHEESLGVATARNRGVFHAKGEWVGLCDNDDLWHPRRIEVLSEAATSHPAAAAIATGATGFALESERELLAGHQRHAMVTYWVESDDIDALASLVEPIDTTCIRTISYTDLQEESPFVTTLVVLRRETYAIAGGCATWCHLADDWILNGSVALLGDIVMIDAPLVLYRVRADSQSHAEIESAMPILAAFCALRFGGRTADRRSAGVFYEHILRVAAVGGMPAREVAAFAIVGNLGAHRTLSLLKAGILSRMRG